MNRVVFVSLTILCLLSISAITGVIQVAKATGGTITINADGSISPSAPIYSADNVTYTLTGNITANNDGIVIERNNTILNGAGYTVTGSGSDNGIYLANMGNVTVTNMRITNFTRGIRLGSSSNCILSGNNVANDGYGIGLGYSSYCILSGNNVTANSNDGIFLISSSGNALSGNNVANNGYGIQLVSSSGNALSGNNVAKNYDGVWLESSSDNNVLSDNTVTANSVHGVGLASCSNCTLSGNAVTNSPTGIFLISSSNNVIFHNNFMNNTSQIDSSNSTNIWDNGSSGNYWSDYPTRYPSAAQVDSSGVWNTSYVIDANNTDRYPLTAPTGALNPAGAPIYINADGSITPSTAPVHSADNVTYTLTGNITSNANGIVIERNNTILNGAGHTVTGSGSGWGISLTNMSIVTINNMRITNFTEGIVLEYSSNCILSGNNVTANDDHGIYLWLSSGNTLSGNNVTSNSYFGIDIDSSSNNTLSGNSVTANSNAGIASAYSDNNTLSGNNVTANNYGIELGSSSGNTLSGNTVANNPVGIFLISSSNNIIYHNNFINNTNQVYSSNSTNVWDNGSVGNYWSDYLTRYPSAAQVDSSGVWNTSYVIDANNTDHYPLMVPFVAVPEFPSLLILPLFMIATLLAVIVYRKKGVKTSQGACAI